MKNLEILARHRELLSLKSTDNWSNVRTLRNFNLTSIDYGFGPRNTLVPLRDHFNENLQDSRGNSIKENQKFEEYVEDLTTSIDNLSSADLLRINELESFVSSYRNKNSKFCEIGFRNPKLLKFYKDIFGKVVGFDISKINVNIAKELGFDCYVWDLNNLSYSNDLRFDFAVCYHVLEHTHNPLESLKKIKSILHDDGILHIEVPIEPGMPRINFGHLIALERKDLQKMLELCQFEILNISYQTHDGGPEIERIIAKNVHRE